ncbi:hypothetical protein [Bradyrhizobium diazoefficiens]|uniref:hypothetical protein n=1 Tax=Bradyrhizobium diazoefficiens TaxID=1355477 RepID=UPI0007C5EEF8|nr:hypothetical protein [Bradyrhizobium diazoefficiens]AND90510.1 hypothetical protein AAV28_24010 [Bradyrhizobium diazoefficiens USDA 110]QBP24100.1 hypothetical protein Bdiaspc4_28050 [Bradyrhizobium diazoefficiens]BCF45240.1 hypothetical protein XF16B_57300 [Bradyrhizobium diazoefficiens]BCF71390.1 hypothetical protein XF19B_57430 [Bradyrhizobium diazoefficiens]
MSDQSIADALNAFADTLNEAAATLDAISRSAAAKGLLPNVVPGSPVARMVEQAERAAATLPQPSQPTTWEPEWPS